MRRRARQKNKNNFIILLISRSLHFKKPTGLEDFISTYIHHMATNANTERPTLEIMKVSDL